MSFNTIVRNQDFQSSSFAEYGFRVVDSGFTKPTGEVYRAITVLQDATVTLTCDTGDNLTSKVLLAGTTIYGKFSDVSVSAGLIIAYIGG